MAGIAAAFAGVSGGFGANFFIGSVDPILAGLSQSAAGIIGGPVTGSVGGPSGGPVGSLTLTPGSDGSRSARVRRPLRGARLLDSASSPEVD